MKTNNYETRVYELTDPKTGVSIPCYGWRTMCRRYKNMYDSIDILEKKRRMMKNNVPVYVVKNRARGGRIVYNAAVNPWGE